VPFLALIIVAAIQEEPGHFLIMALQSTPWTTTHPKAGAQRFLCRWPIAALPPNTRFLMAVARTMIKAPFLYKPVAPQACSPWRDHSGHMCSPPLHPWHLPPWCWQQACAVCPLVPRFPFGDGDAGLTLFPRMPRMKAHAQDPLKMAHVITHESLVSSDAQ
jgi:hypothetical protein